MPQVCLYDGLDWTNSRAFCCSLTLIFPPEGHIYYTATNFKKNPGIYFVYNYRCDLDKSTEKTGLHPLGTEFRAKNVLSKRLNYKVHKLLTKVNLSFVFLCHLIIFPISIMFFNIFPINQFSQSFINHLLYEKSQMPITRFANEQWLRVADNSWVDRVSVT